MPRTASVERAVIVTRRTALEELVERFNTREQARFYLEHMGASFEDYEAAHDTYVASVAALRDALPDGLRAQSIERSFLPNFIFNESDLVVVIGQDGLVVNAAKYLSGQPLLAFNPDPARFDGILIPFEMGDAAAAFAQAAASRLPARRISMAKAQLNDGQSLYAVNDLFIGARTHVSARYRLRLGEASERQSSSGIIVSTGTGSTGWLRSVVKGAAGVMVQVGAGTDEAPDPRFDWESEELVFSVREPFVSRTTEAGLVFGRIRAGETLELVSEMPQNGIIFSDGVESDFLEFNSSAVATIGLAEKKVVLLTP